jgi:endonuclease YncB( thermonuclease family)
MGTLQIKGQIDLKKFWPVGKSDADTTKVILNVDKSSFKFQKTAAAPFKIIHDFEGAYLSKGFKDGIEKKQPIINVLKASSNVTIRLQGIDAPELHYKIYFSDYLGNLPKTHPFVQDRAIPPAIKIELDKNNKPEYRQLFGETATVELVNLLKQAPSTGTLVDCTVESKVDRPQDVIDKYGRIVGDIFVMIKGKKINVNHWLLENGWAFASIYNSMTDAEITKVLTAAKKGKALKQNDIYTQFTPQKVDAFDFALQYRNKGVAAKERGKVIIPKLFRRLCVYSIFKKSGIDLISLKDYLFLKGGSDFYLLKDFMKKANRSNPNKTPVELKTEFIHRLFDHITNKNIFNLLAEEMVLREDPATVKGPGIKS